LADGSGKDFYIRIVLVVTDVSVITIIMDPAVVIATQVYVNNYAYWATEADRLWNGVEFEADVVQNDVVYYNPATSKFGRAIADGTIKQRAIGFADLTPNYRNTHGQIVIHGECPYTFAALTPGAIYYLSTSSLGKIQSTAPDRYTVKVGTARAIGVMLVDVDDILSGYEDLAMSIHPTGDVDFHQNVDIALSLGVGSEGGFPAFEVNTAGDVVVTGGADSIWVLSHTAGIQIFSVDASHNLFLQQGAWRLDRATGNLRSYGDHFQVIGGNVAGSGDVYVTGGTDSIWQLLHNSQVVVGVAASHEVSLFMGSRVRGGSETSLAYAIPLGTSAGKIDSSWLPVTPTPSGITPDMLTSLIVGDVIRGASPSSKNGGYMLTYTKEKEIETKRPGNFRIIFSLWVGTPDFPCTAYARIYRNGLPIGTERSVTALDPGGNFATFSEDFSGFVVNDLIQIYVKQDTNVGGLWSIYGFYICADWDMETTLS
jgi:hypothetical protein